MINNYTITKRTIIALSVLSILNIVSIGIITYAHITPNSAFAETAPVDITDWKGCLEDEVTVFVTIDPLNKLQGSNIQYCTARDDLRVK